jgi:hypothetical protein
MEILTENDHEEISKMTNEDLNKYVDECMIDLDNLITSYNTTTDPSEKENINTNINEVIAWINAYNSEITKRKSISTPPMKPKCVGCEEGQLNQQGHYGGCIIITDEFTE